MSLTASESLSPLGEPQAITRKKRLAHLARVVFELMGERVLFPGGRNREFDGIEDARLIDALRACSHYTDQIGCLDFGDPFVVELKGIDGHHYIIQFSLIGPGFSVHSSRVRITSLPLVVGNGQIESTYNTLDILENLSQRHKLKDVSTDRAFLIGMSMVIGFMETQEDDPEEDDRLAPLVALIMPTSEELDTIQAKLPKSTINYDDEGDQPC